MTARFVGSIALIVNTARLANTDQQSIIPREAIDDRSFGMWENNTNRNQKPTSHVSNPGPVTYDRGLSTTWTGSLPTEQSRHGAPSQSRWAFYTTVGFLGRSLRARTSAQKTYQFVMGHPLPLATLVHHLFEAMVMTEKEMLSSVGTGLKLRGGRTAIGGKGVERGRSITV